MQLEYLADHVSHLPQLATWHHAQFGYLNPANSVERYVERLTASLHKSDLPTTFIALKGDTLLGSASLVRQTITHPNLSPWLSSVYVDPQHRGGGIASALVGRVNARPPRWDLKKSICSRRAARNCTPAWAGS